MSAADRVVALGQSNERLQLVLFGVVWIGASIWCARYALRLMRDKRAKKHRLALQADAARRARIVQTELCRQRIEFLRGRSIYLPRETAPSGHTVTSLRREKAALN